MQANLRRSEGEQTFARHLIVFYSKQKVGELLCTSLSRKTKSLIHREYQLPIGAGLA